MTEEEKSSSSTARELAALEAAYCETDKVVAKHAAKRILHLTDSSSTAAIMSIGSPIAKLHELALKIHKACWANGITLKVAWRSREDERMKEADSRSRFEKDGWMVGYKGFQQIKTFSSKDFQIDLFSSRDNRKCEVYCSRFPDGDAAAINAFAVDWRHFGHFYACPPPYLGVAVIKKLIKDQARGGVVLPRWPGARFWTHLLPDGSHFAKFVVNFMILRPVCVQDPAVKNKLFEGKVSFDLIVVKVDGNGEKAKFVNVSKKSCIVFGCTLCE
jgi:hypothetical protein